MEKAIIDFRKLGNEFPGVSGKEHYKVIKILKNGQGVIVQRPFMNRSRIEVDADSLLRTLFHSEKETYLQDMKGGGIGESLPAAIFLKLGLATKSDQPGPAMLEFNETADPHRDVMWRPFRKQWHDLEYRYNNISNIFLQMNHSDEVQHWFKEKKSACHVGYENRFSKLKEHYEKNVDTKLYFIVNYYAMKPGVHECYYLDHWWKRERAYTDVPDYSTLEVVLPGQQYHLPEEKFGTNGIDNRYKYIQSKYGKEILEKSVSRHIRYSFRDFIFQSFKCGFNILDYGLSFAANDKPHKDRLSALLEISNPKGKPFYSVRDPQYYRHMVDLFSEAVSEKDLGIIFSNMLNKRNARTYSPCAASCGPLHFKIGDGDYASTLCKATRSSYRNPGNRKLDDIIDDKQDRVRSDLKDHFKLIDYYTLHEDKNARFIKDRLNRFVECNKKHLKSMG